MAQQVRIDSFFVDGSGVHIGYTQGEYPLPGNVSGNGVNHGSVEDYIAALQQTELQLSDLLLNIVLAKQFKIDANIDHPETYVGKTGVMDLTTPTDPITFG